MRRPLKPFVTEYKGGRRPSPLSVDPAPYESERPAPKPAEFKPKAGPDSDDSYEAAMRAADALFAAPEKSEPAVASDAATPQPLAGENGNGERAGRILRVIDEPPPARFAALEAQLAPKRRGRKPGSKNKPKVPALPVASRQSAALPEPATVEETAPLPARRQVAALPAIEPSSAALGPALRGDRRFPWVRDRLKPGEHWKRRRLPRICW